ncbi:hypothetical protein EJ05DRAFT_516364 [Pseudovirgaria hyperparasitica]|uniref:PWI domain-containing protein n=1 Tax=Pseudovirgaria hyperparasitica TaxID=470096 RepID=A0A6A6WL49_9PEZI|nr:uncharacterized protein EJ05DRAFT_516364 [Pseudovirgaria hyperparasitica]KAF2762901.1 hypothetical protein EJ05DRAFT_516364 [Pseudovirgaria hyperparasitica]
MYNYQQPPAQFGRQPSYGSYPGQSASPGVPGMGAPPGMGGPPGIPPGGAPPGIHQTQTPQPGRSSGLPSNFQPPPNLNFNAPVIRLGTSGPIRPDNRQINTETMVAGPRRGLGMGSGTEQQRQQIRENMMALAPPSREEVARTIFVGNITEGVGGDEGLERILRTAGGLRRWTRASDADGKPCKFGFAEYEDAESLETAIEIFQNIEIPTRKIEANGTNGKSEDDVQPEMSILLVVVDEASKKYAEDWKGKRNESEETVQFRLDSAKENLAGVLASLQHPQTTHTGDRDGDIVMGDAQVRSDPVTGEVITIPLSVDDELSDIPAEMRETVAAEIAAFRERSTRRDLERLRREEEMEAAERQRAMGARRSPPASAPTGPGGANGIPLGPRERGVAGAPSGPKGFQGAQIPKDYQAGVNFVNGGTNGTVGWISREDDDDPASDSEIESRRRAKLEAEQEKAFLEYERRWENREKQKIAAIQREKAREEDDKAREEKDRANMAKRLAEWNDDVEATRQVEEFYRDRTQWARNRAIFRGHEARNDDRDRADEDREKQREYKERERTRGLADSFLDRQAEEMESRVQAPREPQRFKMSLGAAAQKVQAATKPVRTAAEVEGLLEDEEDVDVSNKRSIIPIKIDTQAEGALLSEEERKTAAQRLAGEIPNDTEALWNWDIRWDFLDDSVVNDQLMPFIERKIVEYLGVQEQMLVDEVSTHIKKRQRPEKLVEELSIALDDEAEVLVKKLWRMIIFFSESEKRGIAG